MIATKEQVILFLGMTYLGSIHDFTLLKNEFSIRKKWFKYLQIWIDLGYLGFNKNYETKNTQIPFKKPRKSKKNPNPSLTKEQKEHNRFVAKHRIKVENAIGGMKRYNILTQKFRNKSTLLRDKVIFIAAGLWNRTKGVQIM